MEFAAGEREQPAPWHSSRGSVDAEEAAFLEAFDEAESEEWSQDEGEAWPQVAGFGGEWRVSCVS